MRLGTKNGLRHVRLYESGYDQYEYSVLYRADKLHRCVQRERRKRRGKPHDSRIRRDADFERREFNQDRIRYFRLGENRGGDNGGLRRKRKSFQSVFDRRRDRYALRGMGGDNL